MMTCDETEVLDVALDNDFRFRFRIQERNTADELVPATGLATVTGHFSLTEGGVDLGSTSTSTPELGGKPGTYAGILAQAPLNAALAAYVWRELHLVCLRGTNLEGSRRVRIVPTQQAG